MVRSDLQRAMARRRSRPIQNPHTLCNHATVQLLRRPELPGHRLRGCVVAAGGGATRRKLRNTGTVKPPTRSSRSAVPLLQKGVGRTRCSANGLPAPPHPTRKIHANLPDPFRPNQQPGVIFQPPHPLPPRCQVPSLGCLVLPSFPEFAATSLHCRGGCGVCWPATCRWRGCVSGMPATCPVFAATPLQGRDRQRGEMLSVDGRGHLAGTVLPAASG